MVSRRRVVLSLASNSLCFYPPHLAKCVLLNQLKETLMQRIFNNVKPIQIQPIFLHFLYNAAFRKGFVSPVTKHVSRELRTKYVRDFLRKKRKGKKAARQAGALLLIKNSAY